MNVEWEKVCKIIRVNCVIKDRIRQAQTTNVKAIASTGRPKLVQ